MKQKKKDANLMSTRQLIRRCFGLVFRYGGGQYTVWIAITLLTAGFAITNLFVTEYFFDRVGTLIGGGTFTGLLMPMLVYFGFLAVNRFAPNLIGNYSWRLLQEVMRRLFRLVNAKASRLPPVLYEQKSFQDELEKARYGAGQGIVWYVEIFRYFLFYNLPICIVMSWYLFNLKPILVITVALIFLPVFLTEIVQAKLHAKKEETVAPLRRKMEYYENCLTRKEHFKEVRLLGATRFFRKRYQDVQTDFMAEEWKVIRKEKIIEFLSRVVTLLGYGGVLWLLIDALVAGEIGVGAFAAVFTALRDFFDSMDSLVWDLTRGLSQSAGKASNTLRFLDYEEEHGEPLEPQSGEIILENVSFAYPDREENAVESVSLTSREGEPVAIVGENGAGKSTLVRLLTGLYPPSAGKVSVGGVDTAVADPGGIRKAFSAVFQQYGKYKFNLRENIAIGSGDLEDTHGNAEAACEKAGIDLSSGSYPDGIETNLAKEFGGVDLSGGQWQRVAIARGLYQQHDIILLDEPTAAIDPLEESRLYESFAEISKGKTSVLVTHRLGSARIADRIVVMEKGKITEVGSHDELIAKNGTYAEMFAAQAEWYR